MLAGADGYRKRWIAAIDEGGGATRIELVDTVAELIGSQQLELLLIDVPIGLMDAGPRQADVRARRMIGPRRSSVFAAPIRPMLGATSYREACDIRYGIEGKRCSKQLFHIIPLIRQLDELVTPDLQERVREGHPEVSFTALGGAPMAAAKLKPEGRAQRLALLRKEFPDLDANIERFGRRGAMVDILDAYVLLWSARRIAAGRGSSIPAEPEHDRRGLRAEIVY
jgi:predicted RNase H-like nuclease